MIHKVNADEPALAWQNHAYHIAARFKVLNENDSETGRVLFVEIEIGGRILPHAQKRAELLFCIGGAGTFSLDGNETDLRAGDMVRIERGKVQGVHNGGEQPLLLLVIEGDDAHTRPDIWTSELARWWGRRAK